MAPARESLQVMRIGLLLREWLQCWKVRRKYPTARVGRAVGIKNPELLTLGESVLLGDYVRIKGDVCIKRYSAIRSYVFLDARVGKIVIGENCRINDYCVFYGMGGVEIGNDVNIATHTVIVSANHNFHETDRAISCQGTTLLPVRIADDVWIGTNVSILGGIEIGQGCVIGAGSVVSCSIPPFSVAVGVPARVIKSRRNASSVSG